MDARQQAHHALREVQRKLCFRLLRFTACIMDASALCSMQAQLIWILSMTMQLLVNTGQTLMLWIVETQWPALSMCMTLSAIFLRLRYADPAGAVLVPMGKKHALTCAWRLQRKRRPCLNYMEAVQQDVNAHMRGILVDWLVEVAQEYKLVSETLFLAVNYIDRFLSCEVAPRRKLQLVGITCMLVAAKYEEIYAPQIEDFCYITDNTYTRDEVLAMEQQVSNRQVAFQLCYDPGYALQ